MKTSNNYKLENLLLLNTPFCVLKYWAAAVVPKLWYAKIFKVLRE